MACAVVGVIRTKVIENFEPQFRIALSANNKQLPTNIAFIIWSSAHVPKSLALSLETMANK